jgi:hypothetical protein
MNSGVPFCLVKDTQKCMANLVNTYTQQLGTSISKLIAIFVKSRSIMQQEIVCIM